MLTLLFAMRTFTVFVSHEDTGDSWTEFEQEFYCDSSLNDLNITSTVTDDICDIIGDSADDWTAVENSDWKLSESSSTAINFKSADLGSSGNVGRMNHFALFGVIITVNVELDTNSDFGDSTVDSNVYDIYTIIRHEMGHLPIIYHNKHTGDESISVMRNGLEIGQNAQRTISTTDAAALASKY